MKFSDLEKLMFENGISSLAEIARTLNTTPQAVSNWKARDQVPYHVLPRAEQIINKKSSVQKEQFKSSVDDDKISLSDIILLLTEQLKIVFIVPFITVFLTFTYILFLEEPLYTSTAKILLPASSSSGNISGLAGLASQFGVNIPSSGKADLSSPSLFPEILRSRTFAEKMLNKEFYSKKFGKTLSLFSILTNNEDISKNDQEKEKNLNRGIGAFNGLFDFENDSGSEFFMINVTTRDPNFSKNLADVIVSELEKLNRFYKSQSVKEKIIFINNRIKSVNNDLDKSEKKLKLFREQNRQILSPSLKLVENRLLREVEVQIGVYLTLKQQLELAKIEEIQEASIFQFLDSPQIPTGYSNKNLILGILSSGIFGIALGVIMGLSRAYIKQSNIEERKKIRRIRNFLKKKSKDIFLDLRVSGVISILLLIGLPYYLGHESESPVYFGRYSATFMYINIIYVLTLIVMLVFSIRSLINKKKS